MSVKQTVPSRKLRDTKETDSGFTMDDIARRFLATRPQPKKPAKKPKPKK
jgi:hypothetical protein